MKRTRKTQYRPTTRRPKRARRGYVDVKRNLADKILREKWINSKSPAANLKRFTIGEFEDQLADDADLMMKTPEKKLNEMETKIISKLIEKYQDDYTKMGRDSRVNVYQWTARNKSAMRTAQSEPMYELADKLGRRRGHQLSIQRPSRLSLLAVLEVPIHLSTTEEAEDCEFKRVFLCLADCEREEWEGVQL
ncbi:hypothetical protein cyc_05527 [Cyclospora cayetanensis]|uniref:Uncharacterized protein n=1 Tax=Cyclospora cayetanensis TaxID=88456 RepID=A0A1D3CSR0_9EIME|nr:hypothetical protein cyc_05527 [Cyclospora cayetanensis]